MPSKPIDSRDLPGGAATTATAATATPTGRRWTLDVALQRARADLGAIDVPGRIDHHPLGRARAAERAIVGIGRVRNEAGHFTCPGVPDPDPAFPLAVVAPVVRLRVGPVQ